MSKGKIEVTIEEPEKKNSNSNNSGLWLAMPFFTVLMLLTVISFIIPLRPTQSNREKRNLAEFPEFSWEALGSGTYFDDITTWFSDTFPGREDWLTLSASIDSLHGHSEVSIDGAMLQNDQPIPQIPDVPAPVIKETADDEEQETIGTETEPTEATEEKGWGGVDAGNAAEVDLAGNAIVRIGDSVFNAVGFSQPSSDRYAQTMNKFAEILEPLGARVVSAPSPTAISILVEPEYLQMLGCVSQDDTIEYMHAQLRDDVVKVNSHDILVEHNDEYIYFRTDHHWNAVGAYYAYTEICKQLGYEPASLDAFEEWDQGEFEGSLYWKTSEQRKLRLDNLVAYVPKNNVEAIAYHNSNYPEEVALIQDMTHREINAKYLAFLSGDKPMMEITNHDLPDGPSCIIVKDSFGNTLVPFLTQNYHKIYTIDYRKYDYIAISKLVEDYDIDELIFVPYVIGTQSTLGNDMFQSLCK